MKTQMLKKGFALLCSGMILITGCQKEEILEPSVSTAENSDNLLTLNTTVISNFLATPRIRKNQKDLTPQEWDKFINAVKLLKAPGAAFPNYNDLAKCHQTSMHHTGHQFPYFLTWHREYLQKFEDRLRKIDPTIIIPYWDWTVDRQIPARLSNAAEWGVTRAFGPNDMLTPELLYHVNQAMSATNFQDFHERIWEPHGIVHTDVGGNGQFADINNSPLDVLFWLHHAFIDKLWSDWQQKNPGLNLSAPEPHHPNHAPLPIFTYTGDQVMDRLFLKYTYDNNILGYLKKNGTNSWIPYSQTPVNSVIVCKTSLGYAKFQIISNVSNTLTIKWVRYNNSGTIASQGTNSIAANKSFDFDKGIQTESGDSTAEFKWNVSSFVIGIIPMNNLFAKYNQTFTFDQIAL